MAIKLAQPIIDLVEGANKFDLDAFMSPLADDAHVNDKHREFWGKDAIRRWCESEIIGEKVSIEPHECVEQGGSIIVWVKLGGGYNKTGWAADERAALYFTLSGGKIKQIVITPIVGRD